MAFPRIARRRDRRADQSAPPRSPRIRRESGRADRGTTRPRARAMRHVRSPPRRDRPSFGLSVLPWRVARDRAGLLVSGQRLATRPSLLLKHAAGDVVPSDGVRHGSRWWMAGPAPETV